MFEGGTFNQEKQLQPVNHDITITFTPNVNAVSYTYKVYKDNEVVDTNILNQNTPYTFTLSQTGTYKITVDVTLNTGLTFKEETGNYVIDKEKPKLNVSEKSFTISDIKNLPEVTASDNYDGDLTSKITSNINDIDFETSGPKTLTYTVTDAAGNKNSINLNLDVSTHEPELLLTLSLIIIALVAILIYFNRLRKAFKLEKRISSYVVEPLNKKTNSFIDKLLTKYQKIIKSISKILSKSVFAQKYAKKYEKYTKITKYHERGLELISGKIVIGLIFVLIAVFAKALQLQILSFYEFVLIFVLGFFALDILLLLRYKVYRSKLESDFLSAITVMNNAFKAGRSITQAIDIVGKEVKGVIGDEFQKMSLELLYGLELESVFKRFSKRTGLEEAKYLTASLTIINKTGGNIIKIFENIENSMFEKQKLKLELESLTSGSKLVVYTLLAMPFLFVLVITTINPTYFLPFINNELGIILLIFMIIYYIIFIVCIRRIMKVEKKIKKSLWLTKLYRASLFF